MVRSPHRAKTKHAPRKAVVERRQVSRGNLKLLTAFRCLDADAESHTGFVRALNLSSAGALLESPDEFALGRNLALEFLLDNNQIARTEGRVTRVSKHDKFYHVAVAFAKVSQKSRRLIGLQIAS